METMSKNKTDSLHKIRKINDLSLDSMGVILSFLSQPWNYRRISSKFDKSFIKAAHRLKVRNKVILSAYTARCPPDWATDVVFFNVNSKLKGHKLTFEKILHNENITKMKLVACQYLKFTLPKNVRKLEMQVILDFDYVEESIIKRGENDKLEELSLNSVESEQIYDLFTPSLKKLHLPQSDLIYKKLKNAKNLTHIRVGALYIPNNPEDNYMSKVESLTVSHFSPGNDFKFGPELKKIKIWLWSRPKGCLDRFFTKSHKIEHFECDSDGIIIKDPAPFQNTKIFHCHSVADQENFIKKLPNLEELYLAVGGGENGKSHISRKYIKRTFKKSTKRSSSCSDDNSTQKRKRDY